MLYKYYVYILSQPVEKTSNEAQVSVDVDEFGTWTGDPDYEWDLHMRVYKPMLDATVTADGSPQCSLQYDTQKFRTGQTTADAVRIVFVFSLVSF